MTELLRIAQQDFAQSFDPCDWYYRDDDLPEEGNSPPVVLSVPPAVGLEPERAAITEG